MGLMFALDGDEVWLLQDFPLEILNERLEVYLEHASIVIASVLPTLRDYLRAGIEMTSVDIDAIFERLERIAH